MILPSKDPETYSRFVEKFLSNSDVYFHCSNRMFGGEEFAFADWPWAVFIGADVPVIQK